MLEALGLGDNVNTLFPADVLAKVCVATGSDTPSDVCPMTSDRENSEVAEGDGRVTIEGVDVEVVLVVCRKAMSAQYSTNGTSEVTLPVPVPLMMTHVEQSL